MNINVNGRQAFILVFYLDPAYFHRKSRKSFGKLVAISVAHAMPGRVATQKKTRSAVQRKCPIVNNGMAECLQFYYIDCFCFIVSVFSYIFVDSFNVS